MTWEGVNYGIGVNTMPEAAAEYAKKRNFGTDADEEDGSGIDASISDLPEDFPLRSRLIEQGVTTREQIDALGRQGLVDLKYVTEKNVDSILDYGKE